jgi:hypothetical protein
VSAVHVREADAGRASWPATPDGDYARRWIVPFIERGPQRYIENVTCRLSVVMGATWALPVTETAGRVPDNAYVVSPYTHYVSYLREELRLVRPPAIRKALSLVVAGVGRFLRAGAIDRVVTINNWMVSTNLYPALLREDVTDAVDAVRQAYPDHAIVFRSLNALTAGPVMDILRVSGFTAILSRRVYVFDARREELFQRKCFRKDRARIASQGYVAVRLTDVDDATARRVVALYRSLYLDKYSRHNPAFTAGFISLAAREGLLTLYALMRDGRIDGVVGFFERNGIMTTPLLGYDTAMPADTGLYRMLTALLSTLARERGVILHRSSGAATFKRSRGAVPALEYSMVDCRHLSRARQAPWRFLRALTEYVGKPLIERYDR